MRFSKMHGTGNDFVVVEAISQTVDLNARQIQKLADRHLGIGFDQLLLLQAPTDDQADFRYRIFNADGQEVAQCGNGARCAAQFIHQHQLSQKNPLRLQTQTRLLQAFCLADGQIKIAMGAPEFRPAVIPFIADKQQNRYLLEVDGNHIECAVLSMGNPHCVLQVDDITTAPVATIGAKLAQHPHFPVGANINFVEYCHRQLIKCRVYERGVGETLACGSGACASMVAGYLQQKLDHDVTVELPGGVLHVSWQGQTTPVWLTGQACWVYEGEVKL
jgi:diaminopimelate epimerase